MFRSVGRKHTTMLTAVFFVDLYMRWSLLSTFCLAYCLRWFSKLLIMVFIVSVYNFAGGKNIFKIKFENVKEP